MSGGYLPAPCHAHHFNKPSLPADPLGGLAALAREWAAAPDAPRALCIVLEGGLVKSEHPSCFEDGPSHFYK